MQAADWVHRLHSCNVGRKVRTGKTAFISCCCCVSQVEVVDLCFLTFAAVKVKLCWPGKLEACSLFPDSLQVRGSYSLIPPCRDQWLSVILNLFYREAATVAHLTYIALHHR